MVASVPCQGKRGQMLVVTSLVVVMLLVSAVMYVNEIEKNTPISQGELGFGVSAVRQAVQHAVVSALANVTNGGNESILLSDLNQLRAVLAGSSYSGILNLQGIPLNNTPYLDGVWVSWNQSNVGVSSIYVSFAVNSSAISGSYFSESAVNVTSVLNVAGSYSFLNESLVEVTVPCAVWNENEPAKAESLDVYFLQGELGQWQQANSTVVAYGNGTYALSFNIVTVGQIESLQVSVHARDARGISVWANATCTQP